ncbi:hypothetical protein HPB51_015415 [Rhipicephalus microplus]|uniref:Troponin I n=1 Tax=Rhipicephalus microplus TaxID=6941 RepID=A0A9J6DW22_RHIMP|nr:hypothetical protein HPB51_015415 [Rhipicephalus microplus]
MEKISPQPLTLAQASLSRGVAFLDFRREPCRSPKGLAAWISVCLVPGLRRIRGDPSRRTSEAPRNTRRKDAEDAHRRLKEEEKRKMEEKERKKAEVRKRLEEAAKAKKAGGKRGFMTPERKKKLRNLLRKKAAEELKKEQERKAEQRRKIIAERVGQPKPLDGANEATLQGILKQYHARIAALEDAKYDLEYEVRQKDFVVRAIHSSRLDASSASPVKPALKKVSKFDKLKMVAKSTSEVDFRSNLKAVKKDAFKLDEEKQAVKKDVPEWAAKTRSQNGPSVQRRRTRNKQHHHQRSRQGSRPHRSTWCGKG